MAATGSANPQNLTGITILGSPSMTAPAAMLHGPEELMITFRRRPAGVSAG